MNTLKRPAAFSFLALLVVLTCIGLWIALGAWGIGGVPPFPQPERQWYGYELPGNWLVIPAAVIAVAVWLAFLRLTGGPGVGSSSMP